MRREIMAAAALLTLAAGNAGLAADKAPPSRWVATPPKASWYAAWPQAARQAGIGGWAMMRCHIEDSGALSACEVTREGPAGRGFGAALVSLAPQYRHQVPGPKDDRSVELSGDWFEFDTPPDWLRRPTAEELLAVYPRAAFKAGTGGKAVIACIVTVQGALMECLPLSESPAGSGFGSAAVALTPQFLMKPARQKGVAVVSMVRIPIVWEPTGRPGETFGAHRVVSGDLPWAEAPSYADVAAAYPKKARDEKVAGRATLACDLTEEGRLSGCNVPTVEPRGYGFDAAAKGLAKRFRFQVGTDADRKATHGIEIHLTMVFDPSTLDATTPVVGKPKWASVPKAEQMEAAFAALGLTNTARVSLECRVQVGGGVADCQVASEDPAGKGLGAAALSLAPAFRLTTWTAEGLPTIGGLIRVPIRYEPGAAPAK